MAAYSIQKYFDMMMVLGECQGQYHVAARRYAELYPNRDRHLPPNVIHAAAQKFHKTGSVLSNKKDAGRNREVRKKQR